MSDSKKTTPPAAAGGAAPVCDPAIQPCPLQCPAMEIEINNTPAVDDDYVQVKCTRPALRHRIPCRIRVKAAAPASTDVVLTNPDGRLRFPGDADRTVTVAVPADGSWAAFEISGETGSAALNDAVIEAHCKTAAGAIIATKTATVFWFDEAKTGLAAGGNYAITGGQYTSATNAVAHSVEARIRPAGVNCAAPQISKLRIGIMQNDITRGVGSEIIWDRPAITWSAGVAAGTTVRVPSVWHQISTLPVAANDVAPTVAPLYDQPGKADTLDPNSLKPPKGCAGGAAATSFDTPSSPAPATFSLPAVTPAGINVGTAVYRLQKVRVIGSFMVWTVVFDTTTNEFCTLRQRTWGLNVDSSAAGVQSAFAGASDAEPASDPVLAPTANTVVNLPANQKSEAVGAAISEFRK